MFPCGRIEINKKIEVHIAYQEGAEEDTQRAQMPASWMGLKAIFINIKSSQIQL